MADTKEKEQNPLLQNFATPYETVPFEKLEEQHFMPAFKQTLEAGRADIDSIANNEQPPDFTNTIEALDKAARSLNIISNVFFSLNHAETSPQMQKIAREASSMLSDFDNEVIFNSKLFNRVKQLFDQRKKLKLTPEQHTLLKKTYLRFYRNGITLEEEKQERLKAISRELSNLSLQFDDNVLAETNGFILHVIDQKDLAGLPASAIESAAQEAKKRDKKGWVFTLQAPSYLAFMKYADNRRLRERLFRAMGSRGFKNNQYNNVDILKKIINLRLEQANLLNYPTHAHFILEDRMAQSPEKVNDFIDQLKVAAKPPAVKEVNDLQQNIYDTGEKFELQPWDLMYYAEKLKKKKFDFDEEELRPYFELSNVRKGVFALAARLWGLSFKPTDKIQVYNPEVEVYEVFDNDGSFLGVLYLDFFPRDSKNSGAWMTCFREQEFLNGANVRPHVSVVCNFSRPTNNKPALLTYEEFTTFLHEFGHALHGIMSNVNYCALSGTGVYRDFVELPSQLLENWAIEKDFLDMFASHYETGETIPKDMIDKITAIRKFNAAYRAMRQATFSVIDMAWHSVEHPVEAHPRVFEAKAKEPLRLLPEVEGTMISTAFSHIFAGGYAAGYYGYKWAEVLDADAYKVFKKNGIFDRNTAKLFREHILSKGGSEHPMTLYKRFRGKEPSVDAMLERDGLR